MIGSKLGSYEILEEIGHGGAATVYRAHQANMDRDVAVKVINLLNPQDGEAVQRFQREVRLVARLEHAHILPIYDFDGGNDPPYFVMRYLDGGTLADVLKDRGPLLPEEVGRLARQIASALGYAHRQGVIHRDIKPSNILMGNEGNAYVSDFGLAYIMRGHDGGKRITTNQTILGTPAYMAPEQVQDATTIDHRVDIYSFGVLLFELLTGELPFDADEPLHLLMKHIQEPVPSATARNPSLSPKVDAVFKRAMAKKPEERYETTDALVEDLIAALGEPARISPITPQHLRIPSSSKASVPGEPAPKTSSQEKIAETRWLEQAIAAQENLRGKVDDTIIDAAISMLYEKLNALKPTEHQRKQVTLLFMDVVNSTVIVRDLDPEINMEIMDTALKRLAAPVEENGGHVTRFMGDGFKAVFGHPFAQENDPERAVVAGLQMLSVAQAYANELEGKWGLHNFNIRVGINTGLVMTGGFTEGGDTIMGTAVNLAARLEHAANPGTLLISHHTYRHVRGVFNLNPLEPIMAKGFPDPVPVYQVLEAKPRAFRVATRGVEGVETQMVGREGDLKTIQNALLDAVEDKVTQVVTVVGDAGLGKSRLLYEFNNWLDLLPESYRLLFGRAMPETRNRPYALLRDLLAFRFELLDSDSSTSLLKKLEEGITEQLGEQDANAEMAHMLGHLVGFDFSASPHIQELMDDPQQLMERARLLFKRWVAALCKIEPVVIELEDIHNSDDLSLDLFNDLVNEAESLPLIMICLTRPDLYDRRPNWGGGQPFHHRLDLKPLDRRGSRLLVREVLQKIQQVPKELRDLLVERAEGNPFYLEELVKTLIDERVIIKGSPEEWRVKTERLDHLTVPGTLTGLLQARLECLFHPEKLTLQRAAVLGRIFHDRALEYLDGADDTHLEDLPGVLKNLADQEYILLRETSAFAGNTEYTFGSELLRDALLETLLRHQRETYNIAAAKWLFETSGERVGEYTSLIASYYEKGGDLQNAAYYLRLAGEKSLVSSAYTEAHMGFARALSLLEADDPQRPTLQLRLGETYYQLGDYPAAKETFEAAIETFKERNDDSCIADALAWLGQVANWEGDYSQAQAYLENALTMARNKKDPGTVANALNELGRLHWMLENFENALQYYQESLNLARQIGDPSKELKAINGLGLIYWTLGEKEKSRVSFEEELLRAQQVGNRERAAYALNNLGVLAGLEGNHAKAVTYFREAIAISQETGQQANTALFLNSLTEGLLHLGDLAAVWKPLREGLILGTRVGAMFPILEAVRNTGLLLVKTGEKNRGLALLGLALYHPSSNSEVKRLVTEAFQELKLTPEEPSVVKALAAGKELDLDVVTKELLEELEEKV